MPGRKESKPGTADRKLRSAMARLLAGTARNCDGKLTKANLAREAQVSPATMYRAHEVLAEWDREVTAKSPRNSTAARLEAQLAESRAHNRKLEESNTELRRQLRAAATVIAELTARLEDPLSPPMGVVREISVDSPR